MLECFIANVQQKCQSVFKKFTPTIMLTVMIRFRFGTSREGANWRQGAFSGQGAYLNFEKQLYVQNKTLINIKITNNNRNRVTATNC